MAVDIETSVRIRRPRAEVAAFMFDPANDRVWTKNVLASRALAEGRMRPGMAVERTVRFLGRTFTYRYEVRAAEGDLFVELDVNDPFPMRVRYELADAPEGTAARIRASGEPKGFFRLAGPLTATFVRGAIAQDLARLRDHLEARG